MSTDAMPSPLRHRQAERLRGELRSQFLELVMKKGFEGFTMAELADAAGVSVRTLYRYFPNREALAEAVREEVGQSQKELEARRGPGDWSENPDFFAATFEAFEGPRRPDQSGPGVEGIKYRSNRGPRSD